MGGIFALECAPQRGCIAFLQRAARHFEPDLVALAYIAGERISGLDQIIVADRLLHHAIGLFAHGAKNIVHRVSVECGQAHITGAHDLIGNRGEQKPDRRAYPRIGGNDDRVDAGFAGDGGGMQRRRAAKSDHGAA